MTCTSPQKLRREDLQESVHQRFHSKLAKPNASGCVIWLGTLNNRGYGQIQTGGRAGRMRYAHRVAWVLAHGELEDGLMVLHRCDQPRCVNPEHLFLGTAQDNTDDMVQKNRHAWRRPLRWQRLHAIDGERICDLRATGRTQQEIADWFGVSRPLISLILSGNVQHSAHHVAY